MKVTFLVCYAFLIQLNENKTKMRITFAETFSIINSVCQRAFFLFYCLKEKTRTWPLKLSIF